VNEGFHRPAVGAIAAIARHHRVVVTHGSSPKVGLRAYQSALYRKAPEATLDLVEAEAEGFLGYLLQQELENALETVRWPRCSPRSRSTRTIPPSAGTASSWGPSWPRLTPSG
jgi:carbamate kinase